MALSTKTTLEDLYPDANWPMINRQLRARLVRAYRYARKRAKNEYMFKTYGKRPWRLAGHNEYSDCDALSEPLEWILESERPRRLKQIRSFSGFGAFSRLAQHCERFVIERVEVCDRCSGIGRVRRGSYTNICLGGCNGFGRKFHFGRFRFSEMNK